VWWPRHGWMLSSRCCCLPLTLKDCPSALRGSRQQFHLPSKRNDDSCLAPRLSGMACGARIRRIDSLTSRTPICVYVSAYICISLRSEDELGARWLWRQCVKRIHGKQGATSQLA
jgi:hypothetical protein